MEGWNQVAFSTNTDSFVGTYKSNGYKYKFQK